MREVAEDLFCAKFTAIDKYTLKNDRLKIQLMAAKSTADPTPGYINIYVPKSYNRDTIRGSIRRWHPGLRTPRYGPLPYTSLRAEEVIAARKLPNKHLARMNMMIVDDPLLLFENSSVGQMKHSR